jgi:hypothetical protein
MQRKLTVDEGNKLSAAKCWIDDVIRIFDKSNAKDFATLVQAYSICVDMLMHWTNDGKPRKEPVSDSNPVVSHVDLPESVLRLIAIGLVVEKYTNSRGFEFIDGRLSLEEAGRHVSELLSQSNAAALKPEEQPRPSRPAQVTPINPQ